MGQDVGIDESAPHRDGASRQNRPVRTDATVGKSNAAGVHDDPAVDQTEERHMRVPADDRPHLVRQVNEHLGPSFEPAVDEDDFLVVAGANPAISIVTCLGIASSSC